jgi:hypothetical protein
MKLLHDVGRPVWTHSHCETDSLAARSISKIICALELTQEAVPLVRFANELAQECGACVRIIHAVPEIEFRPYRYLDMDLHKFLKECAAKDIAHAQREAGTDFPVTITDGLIGTETAALATDQQADLIVIGRGKTQDVFGTFRTHTYDIIRLAPCPVLSYCSDPVVNTCPEKQKESDAVFRGS